MPTYEYVCKECGHKFETVQSFHDEALTDCPKCDGPLRKVFGNIAITFKGSGFYKTDSRSSSSTTSSTTASTSSESGSSTSATEATSTAPASTSNSTDAA
ncbi:putative regulatory protein, FmdB family [Ferrithrix thermotolerans DSM 19514]|jgi:putative FmdB family regulatory protein|uniref:Putative regulatory protein, FmdB family n=2 Tax=Ferrithrix TaxID=643949 RepID=A0A1M4X277_9ACTN|nr:putative regulatory protein, FmdB family [Ferrithrix thermotolerans DSM 19514]